MRPLPPLDAFETHSAAFFPDQEGLGAWVTDTIISEEGQLHNPHHAHLEHASIGWLWTNALNQHRGRMIVGEARLITPPQERWGSALFAWQLRQWFGHVPDFLIILSAPYVQEADDAAFCALVEHEMYHCAQAIDPFGSPRWTKDGRPIFSMRGHDVEEFVGVVDRYGVTSPALQAMVEAANRRPSVDHLDLADACGTCVLRRVA
jgi:hypothetical protein